jgi:hypothetical protein
MAPFILIEAHPSMCQPYGVDATVIAQATTTSLQELQAGQEQMVVAEAGAYLDYGTRHANSPTLVGMVGPLPLKIYGVPRITSIQSFRGAAFGAGAPGTMSDVALRTVLAENRMTVGRDVQISFSGSATDLLAEAKHGVTKGFVSAPLLPSVAVATGVHEILSLTDDARVAPEAELGLISSPTFLRSHGAVVHGFLACLAKAVLMARSDPTSTTAAISQVLQVSSTEAGEGYEASRSAFSLFPVDKPIIVACVNGLALAGTHVALPRNPSKLWNNAFLKGIKGVSRNST